MRVTNLPQPSHKKNIYICIFLVDSTFTLVPSIVTKIHHSYINIASQIRNFLDNFKSLLKMVLPLMSNIDYYDRFKDRTKQIEEENNAPMRWSIFCKIYVLTVKVIWLCKNKTTTINSGCIGMKNWKMR
jgi:hypothetical protein